MCNRRHGHRHAELSRVEIEVANTRARHGGEESAAEMRAT
jgi:hypothetical protein